jgi:uncharacterized iron-regulated membrane protein
MKTLLAATLLALPFLGLAVDPAPAKEAQKPAAEQKATEPAKATAPAKGSPAQGKDTQAQKPADAKAAAKPDSKTTKPATKDEKPCEPVKPCSID